MKSILPPNTLIVVPFFQPWDRSADFQRQTCLRLAENYHVIANLEYTGEFWLKRLWRPSSDDNFTSLPTKLSLAKPLYFLPGQRWPLIRQWNQKIWLLWLSWRWRQLSPRWLWLFDPEAWHYPTALPGWLSVYDCVDDHSQNDPLETQRLLKQEKVLIKSATIFTVNSQTLAKLHQLQRHPDAVVVQGFDLTIWPKQLPKPHRASASPVLSLLGNLDERIDWSLVNWLAMHLPECQWWLAGPIDPDVTVAVQRCLQQPNVIYLGVLPRTKLAKIYTKTDIGLIPYDVRLPTVRHAFPMKVFEYFAFGKPVVASPISELKLYKPFVTVADSRTNWLTAIQELLAKPWPITNQQHQRQVALTQSYEAKINQIEELMKRSRLD